MNPIRVGSHVPAKSPLMEAAERGADIVQLHLSAPRQWRAPIGRADASELAATGMVSTVHAPYLCNPCSGDAAVRQKTATVLQQTLNAAEEVGARGVIVHAGHATDGASLSEAIARCIEVVAELSSPISLLVENTATGQSAAGRTLAQLVELLGALGATQSDVPIGLCLDTCHAFAGDPDAAADPEGWVAAVAAASGALPFVHVNDSQVGPGEGRDLHAAIGDGLAGTEWIAAFVGACRLAGATDFLVETPGGRDGQRRDIKIVREMAT